MVAFILATGAFAKDQTVTYDVPVELMQFAQVNGAEIMRVMDTGSMKPTFDENTVVVVKPVRFARVKKGDVIVFRRFGQLTVHRAVEPYLDTWITKGDGLGHRDKEPVSERDFIGVVISFYRLNK